MTLKSGAIGWLRLVGTYSLSLFPVSLSLFIIHYRYLISKGKLDAKRKNALANSLLAVWQVFFLPADINQDGSIEIPELVIHMKQVITTTTNYLQREINLTINIYKDNKRCTKKKINRR